MTIERFVVIFVYLLLLVMPCLYPNRFLPLFIAGLVRRLDLV